MTIKTVFVCSECGTERQQANHWFVYIRTADGLEIHRWDWPDREKLESALDPTQLGHLCGHGCAHKLLDRFLNERTTMGDSY